MVVVVPSLTILIDRILMVLVGMCCTIDDVSWSSVITWSLVHLFRRVGVC